MARRSGLGFKTELQALDPRPVRAGPRSWRVSTGATQGVTLNQVGLQVMNHKSITGES